ncbi:hypothetical protein QTI33_16575 [Variovorax sp. J22P271]|uniref:hypothetical protein n=1 Tax=Variovorax davisae TaxID=3053515 RepID=UPI00257715FD|nr:hypothetical protein [Variovorax sp. J22P271]MDM0033751.1 hypothetical protein [Variovorax sp. J22P271]
MKKSLLTLAVVGTLQAGQGACADPSADEPEDPVGFHGQVMLDAIHDAKRMNPQWRATLRPSQIPVDCPGDPGCGKEGVGTFSVRQSSLGFRANIPTPMGAIKTDLSFDLFGTDGGTHVHWLNVWAELGGFGVGQYDSNFMDIDVFPNTIDYWGPSGMMFLRNPQLRYTALDRDGMKLALSLEAPNSVLDTGKLSEVDPGFGFGVQPWNRLPDAIGSFRLERDWGHLRVAGMVRQVGFQSAATPQGLASGHKTGYGLNLSGAYRLLGKDSITGQVAYGHAIASYANDGGVDLAPGRNLRAETVPSTAWLLYYNHAWSEKWSSAIGYSEHRQSNTFGQLGNAFQKGSYASANVLYYPVRNITAGLEFIWGRRENKDGAAQPDSRLQFSTKLVF